MRLQQQHQPRQQEAPHSALSPAQSGPHRLQLTPPRPRPSLSPNPSLAPSPPPRPSLNLNNRPVFAFHTTYATSGAEPDSYEHSVENQMVVAEWPKVPSLSLSGTTASASTNSRARTTILTGRIKHEIGRAHV